MKPLKTPVKPSTFARSIRALTDAVNISPDTMAKARKLRGFPRKTARGFNIKEATAFIAKEFPHSGAAELADGAVRHWRDRRLKAEVLRLEHRLEQLRAAYVPKTLVLEVSRQFNAELFQVLREELLQNFPTKFTGEIAERLKTETAEIIEELKRRVDRQDRRIVAGVAFARAKQ